MTSYDDPDAPTDDLFNGDPETLADWQQYLLFSDDLSRGLYRELRGRAPEPTTVTELYGAVETDAGRRTVYNRLVKMVERGVPIHSKSVGTPSKDGGSPLITIWWYDETCAPDPPATGQFDAPADN